MIKRWTVLQTHEINRNGEVYTEECLRQMVDDRIHTGFKSDEMVFVLGDNGADRCVMVELDGVIEESEIIDAITVITKFKPISMSYSVVPLSHSQNK